MALTPHIRSFINLAIKLIISLILIIVINNYIFGKHEMLESFKAYSFDSLNLVWFFLLVGLMPFNWYVESLKWKRVIQTQKNISIQKAFCSVLSGITLGVITPARIGEYVGRSLLVEKDVQATSYMSTFVCSISQNLINICVGIIVAYFYFKESASDFNSTLLIAVNAIILAIGLCVYFKVFSIIQWLKRFKLFKKKFNNIDLSGLSINIMFEILMLSIIRYLIYAAQYIFALKLFDLDASLLATVKGIGTIFLIQSSIPLPPIVDLFARGELAVIIFSPLGFGVIQILMASTLLWVINLILPALIGWVLIMKLNLLKSVGYEKV